ncbi:MAG TPA: CocE/NonD family hydrolase, partial [Bacteroidota bacterium]|nr:CocE/NonD family hydrolase [Bacteroidota bacterium]
ELPFFRAYLKDAGDANIPLALVFETGSNSWHRFESWPPGGEHDSSLYFREGRRLTAEPPGTEAGFDAYVSDPEAPVPYRATVPMSRGPEYMIDDQRFASERSDVLSYETRPLATTWVAAGPVSVDLYVSTTGTDADFVVKLIDVLPDTATELMRVGRGGKSGAYQMLVRADVLRGKFRNSLSRAEPFVPGNVTHLLFMLRDINHAFLPGHKIMVQVQSSWFPLVDRNPQVFEDIYHAHERDFRKANIRVFRNAGERSRIIIHTLN